MSKVKNILSQSGVSVARASSIIGISRAGLYRLIAEDQELSLDKWSLLFERLSDENSKESRKKAETLLALIENEYGYKIDKAVFEKNNDIYKYNQPNESDEYWIFSCEPLELHELSFLEFMKKYEYSKYKKISYFVFDEYIAKKLTDSIMSIYDDRIIKAKIYVIETNSMLICPHFTINDPRTSTPMGYALTHGKEEHVPLYERSIEEIIRVLRNAKIGLPEYEFRMFPMNDTGDEESHVDYKKFYFKKYFPK